MSQLLVLQAVVEATPEAVAAVLLDVRPGGRSPMALDGTIEETDVGDEFEVLHDGDKVKVAIDRGARSVTIEGAWWYRGVTSVEPDPLGSRVRFRMFNIAEGHGWAVRFVSRGPINAAPREFAETIHRLGTELGVPAHVV
ncbi:hypothetical protein Ade02nite_48730 [Paractinoplanes deccanensis]|uniref:Polyketide cyclase n=1 Tax=Paractinoplanes deccanensis TaxID=113561 RepID=A0ABQ3Y8A5_9ACTN|nr:hypothetical protein [Actinoplanes deccanensis]GID76232.1 hypothetical protein Ade02nite_48730 [Actinoplanes deccanensis]